MPDACQHARATSFLLPPPDVTLEMPRTSLPLSRSLVLSPLAPLLSLPMAEHGHRHRCRLLRPEPLPRLSVVSRRTAPSPYSSSLSRAGREALLLLERHRLLPRDSAITIIAPSSAGLPRARRVLQSTRCEPPVMFHLTPRPFAHRSRRGHRGRSSPPPELVAGVSPVTLWSC